MRQQWAQAAARWQWEGSIMGQKVEQSTTQQAYWERAGTRQGRVQPGIKTRKMVFARSFRGSDIPDISLSNLKRNDRARRSSRGTDISRISYLPNSIKIILGWGGAFRSMVIYTIASTT